MCATTSGLENNLQCELNFPHRDLRDLVDHAEARLRKRIQRNETGAVLAIRKWIICAVENIEKFRTELDVEGFAELRDVVVFDKGHIKVHQTRPNYGIARQVAHQVDTSEGIHSSLGERLSQQRCGICVAVGIPKGRAWRNWINK